MSINNVRYWEFKINRKPHAVEVQYHNIITKKTSTIQKRFADIAIENMPTEHA
jgi:hypothetical protein